MRVRVMHVEEGFLVSRLWMFYHATGEVCSRTFKFEPSGIISGYDHPDQKLWHTAGGMLQIMKIDRTITTVFESRQYLDGKMVLSGLHSAHPDIRLCLMELEEIQD